jgi:Leucine-rich repeat (LRR) protein
MRLPSHIPRCLFTIALFVIALQGYAMTAKLQAEEPLPVTFEEYASRTDLTDDEKYTVELLIEFVRSDFDPHCDDERDERFDAREAADYKPRYEPEHLKPAAESLRKLSWLSLRRSKYRRPVRDVKALRYLPQLEGLDLSENEICDIEPLRHCRRLRCLHIDENPIKDLAPLTHIADLRELHISVDQIPTFKQLTEFRRLVRLEIGLGTFDSFEDFPAMPELRIIWGTRVNSLLGLQQFPQLQNLVNFGGEIDSLEPLRDARHLTHVNITASRIRSLEPLAGLTELRDVFISTEAESLDLSPLEHLPNLHNVGIRCADKEPKEIEKLQAKLTSWDVEFLATKPRYEPSFDIEVIDQTTFDAYVANMEFNVGDEETNEQLLSSERDWLIGRFAEWFHERFKEDEDYTIPYQSHYGRSQTVVLLSEFAVLHFREVIPVLQQSLAHCRKDWVFYLQIEEAEPELAIWVFPDKIVATIEGAEIVRQLLAK